jgi:prophage maintenance system killer protein
MDAVLTLNGRKPRWNTEEIGQIVIRVVQRQMEEGALADWLRERC